MSSQVKASVLTFLEELRKNAQEAQKIEDLVEISKLSKLVETEGQTIVEVPGYRIFVEKCLLEDPKATTQEETRQKMSTCAQKWSELPEEEKKKIKGELEIRESV